MQKDSLIALQQIAARCNKVENAFEGLILPESEAIFYSTSYTGLSNEMWYNRAIWLSRHVLDIVFHLDATNESLFQHLQNLGPDIWLTCLRARCAYTEKSFSYMAC